MKPLFFLISNDGTIAGRLRALRLRVTVALGTLIVFFVVALVAGRFFTHERDRAVALSAQARQISSDLLASTVYEKDFELHPTEEALAKQATAFTVVLDSIERAESSGAEEAALEDLDSKIRGYQSHFLHVVDSARKLGADENHGLEGKLHDAVDAVEKIVRDSHQDALIASMLQLRRHERDFINRVRDEYVQQHDEENASFTKLLAASHLPESTKEQIAQLMATYGTTFKEYAERRKRMVQEMDAASSASEATVAAGDAVVQKQAEAADRIDRTAQIVNLILAVAQLAMLAAVAVGVTLALRRTSDAIGEPLAKLTDTVERLAAGDVDARARIESENEFGAFGRQLDRMVEEREAVAARIKEENRQLNDSVLGLLQAVAQLSRKDLTVKVPVTTDVTGPVADALNLLTGETAKVLQQVSDISADVADASLKVKRQSDTVMTVAEEERRQVEHTAQSLESASRTMATIAELAATCNHAADRAIRTTEHALQAVNSTVGGINNTRETIRETEKRIKRLGERSQEISVAVNLINSIAERTHILALNAAMHAASAGEAGRGFAVVADEVQRLAENARQATQQIATLVGNIQLETADTVNTMNTAISHVVEGSRLAEQAGQQMQATQQTTAELVSSVQRIATQSQEQVQTSNQLREWAALIKKSTEQTSKELSEQTQQTSQLVEYARSLLSAVRVFKLSAT